MVLKHKDWKDVVFFCEAYETLSQDFIKVRGVYYTMASEKPLKLEEKTHILEKSQIEECWVECVVVAGSRIGPIDIHGQLTKSYGTRRLSIGDIKRTVFGPVML